MESYIPLTEDEKTKHKYFNFYLNLLNEEKDKNYINNIFNVPKLPLIGCKNTEDKNNMNSHLLGKILSLVCFQIDICQGKEKNKIDQIFSDFVLPSNLNEYLNIDDVIEIDNNTDEPEVNLFFMPKHKLNFYFIISELPSYNNKKKSENILINDNDNKTNKNKINDFNENDNDIDDNDNINIINENNNNKINIINDKEERNEDEYEEIEDNNNNKFDIEEQMYNDINYNDYLKYNIIPHFFYLNDNEKNLLEIKNLIFNEQITLFDIDDKKYYDIDR